MCIKIQFEAVFMYRLIEIYGSLLSSKEREKTLKKAEKEFGKNGLMREVGKVERKRWKLSFDRFSAKKGAVLNFIYTGDLEDRYYTTVYQVNSIAYLAVMNREMGKLSAKLWRCGRLCDLNSYRPVQLCSNYGITDIFIIPYYGRQRTATTPDTLYVKTVREGIEKSYDEEQKKVNLLALERAIRESKNI